MITLILLTIALLLAYVAYTQILDPLPALSWTRLSDVLFASGFTLLNGLNLANLVLVKLRVPPVV